MFGGIHILGHIPRGTGWMTLNYLAGFTFQGIYILIIAKALGSENYGVFVSGLAIVTVFAALSGLGAGNVLVLQTSRNPFLFRRQYGTALFYIGATFLPLAILALVFANVVSPVVFSVLFPLLIGEIIFTRLFDLGLLSFQAHDQIKTITTLTVSSSLVRVLVSGGFLFFDSNDLLAWAMVYSGITVSSALLVTFKCLKRFGNPIFSKKSIKHTWKIGIPFAANYSARSLMGGSEVFVLSGAGYLAESGQYAISGRITTMAVAPIQASLYSQDTNMFRLGKEGYLPVWQNLKKQIPLLIIYLTLITSMLWLCTPIIASILGSDFSLVSAILPILALSMVFSSIANFVGQALVGLGRMLFRAVLQIIFGILALTLNLVMVPNLGWIAAVWVSVATSALFAIALSLEFCLGVLREKKS